MISEVKVLYDSNARQIPDMLRQLAGNIESPPPECKGKPNQAVCILRDSQTGLFNIYAWGDVTIDSSLAMLSQGTRRLSSIADAGGLWDVPVGGVRK